ncbi:CGNR zinc finger domain-containing protein [Streptomyces sp. YIM 98790]|uniref:CGNR zinc finger domain-containing protein n=1 Tax=Streptomyces sp. YIM 98790 TaxID=2689077 RepID=UPI0014093297|nr:CGNR zinc finger domain-containing protein [Streptomyces sp. YIM 98790]
MHRRTPPSDPRPLTGEPLAIDLLNTRWIGSDGPHDLLDSDEGLLVWLTGSPVAAALDGLSVTVGPGTREPLLRVRDALAALVRDPGHPAARRALNEVLSHGALRRTLTASGPRSSPEAEPDAWLLAWAAAEDYLRLLEERPDRIRKCASPACVLHFYDTSRNGTRRWCSMAGCGNRAKASRHHARQRAAGPQAGKTGG